MDNPFWLILCFPKQEKKRRDLESQINYLKNYYFFSVGDGHITVLHSLDKVDYKRSSTFSTQEIHKMNTSVLHTRDTQDELKCSLHIEHLEVLPTVFLLNHCCTM